jgi:uncharacterized protein YjbI with pentapeptide repeats
LGARSERSRTGGGDCREVDGDDATVAAYLSEADLDGANFSSANLKGAEGMDIATLRAFGCILANTQMPDGSIYAG